MESVSEMWNKFVAAFPEYLNEPYEYWYFGDSPQMALELSSLVLSGRKTATCGALWEYEKENEALPKEGNFSVVTDFHGQALCVIQTKKVVIQKFMEVDADFARKEGEGDLSYEYWNQAHTDFFIRLDSKTNPQFSDDMLLVCEEFEVVFPIKFAP